MDLEKAINLHFENINWFKNCGIEVDINNCKFHYNQVSNIKNVEKEIKSLKWENVIIEAQNRLVSYLRTFHPENHKEWNSIMDFAIDNFNNIKTSLLEKCKEHNLPEYFVTSVRTIYLRIYAELYYSIHLKDIPYFFIDLFEVLKQGKIPCGWDGYPLEQEGYEQIDMQNTKILIW